MADILTVQTFARLKLLRNNTRLAENVYEPIDDTFTAKASERAVLTSSMSSPQEINIGELGASKPGKYLMLVTDKSIQVALDTNTKLWTLEDQGALLFVGSFTHVYVKNPNTTEATIEYVVADGS